MNKLCREALLYTANEFMNQVVKPQVKLMEQNECFSKNVIKEMGSMGLLGSILPVKYGGSEISPLLYGELTKVIGKVSASARTLLTVHTSLVGETLAKFGSGEQKEVYLKQVCSGEKIGCFALSEPNAGTDAASIKTLYQQKKDCYVLNGHKKWISFAGIADFMIVIATSEQNVISAFLVDSSSPGIEVIPMKGLLAARDVHISEIKFNDVRVPKENLLGREGGGFSFITNTALFYGRYSIAWGGLSTALSALEEMVSYSRQRKQFGKRIAMFQLIQGIIGDAVTDVHAAHALCIRAGELRDEGKIEEAVMETNIAKYFTSKTAVKVAGDALQVFGGNGILNDNPIERLYREAKILEIIEGTSQIQQVMIANYGLGKYFKREGEM